MKHLALILLSFSLTTAHAELFRGPMSSALGGAGSAGLPSAEGVFLNPALIPTFEGASLDAYYRDGYPTYGQHRQSWGVGAIDNTGDVWFPGALHYIRTRDTGRAAQPVEGDLWHAGIAERYENLSVGISVYRLIYDVKNDRRYTQWNGAIGALYMFDNELGVAYVLKNLAGPGSEVPTALREDMQQTLGFFAGIAEAARVRVDIARKERFNPDHKMAYMLGLESKTSDLITLRFGYRYDDLAGQRVWTAGIGFDGPKLKLDYAVEKDQEGTPGALHSVDLRLVF